MPASAPVPASIAVAFGVVLLSHLWAVVARERLARDGATTRPGLPLPGLPLAAPERLARIRAARGDGVHRCGGGWLRVAGDRVVVVADGRPTGWRRAPSLFARVVVHDLARGQTRGWLPWPVLVGMLALPVGLALPPVSAGGGGALLLGGALALSLVGTLLRAGRRAAVVAPLNF